MLTLKYIKKISTTYSNNGFRFPMVNADKRRGLLFDRYTSLSNKAVKDGKNITVKFHGVYTWGFSSPCHLTFNANGVISLISYETNVADYFPALGKVIKYGWYSVTTSRHINEFCDIFGSGDGLDVAPNLWTTTAGDGYTLDNMEALGLGKLLTCINSVKHVFKYQLQQMGQLLAALFEDVYTVDDPYLHGFNGVVNNSPGQIIRRLYYDMVKPPHGEEIKGRYIYANDSRNLSKSWDVLKRIMKKAATGKMEVAA